MTSRLHRNFVLLMTTNVLSPLFSMALVVAISRLNGVELLGKYSLVMTVFVLGQTCAGLGLPIVLTRDVAARRASAGAYFASATVVSLAFLVPLVVIARPLLGATMADGEMATAVWLALVALVPSALAVYGDAVLLAFERAGGIVAINLAENLVRTALSTALVIAGHGIVPIALGIVAVRGLAAVAFLVALRRCGVRATQPDRRLCRQLLRDVPVVATIPVVAAVYARADVFLLSWLGTWTELGVYSAGLRLVDLARTVAPAYARALYPVLSRLRTASPTAFAAQGRRAVRHVLLLTVPMSLVLSGVAAPILVLVYGPKLLPAVPSLRVLAWTLVPVALGTTLSQLLFAAERQAVDLRINLLASAIGIAANLVLIPRWGALGAATAVLLSSLAAAAMQYASVRRQVADPAALDWLGQLLVVALGSALAMALLGGHRLVLAGAAGLATYAVGVLAARLVTPYEIDRIRLAFVTLRSGDSGGSGGSR